jgi:2-oxoisovalerate dehydrogenase E1 component
MLLQAVGAADDPASGGRQMPSHWGHRRLQIVSQSSPTGTQVLQAVGCSEAGMYMAEEGAKQGATLRFEPDEVTYVSLGEGATSEGEFWEGLNTACTRRLPVFFLIEDNGYAISVPVEVQTAGGDISRLVRGFPNLLVIDVDGTDLVASYAACRQSGSALPAARPGTFVHARVTRPYCTRSPTITREYRPKPSSRRARAGCDPRLAAWLVREGLATEEELEALRQRVDAEIAAAVETALAAAKPTPDP